MLNFVFACRRVTQTQEYYWFCGKTPQQQQLAWKHKQTRTYCTAFPLLLWSPCILGKPAARLHAQSDQLFKLPWALWVIRDLLGPAGKSLAQWKTWKMERKREREKYHLSAMCHLMQICNVRSVTSDSSACRWDEVWRVPTTEQMTR